MAKRVKRGENVKKGRKGKRVMVKKGKKSKKGKKGKRVRG